MKGEYTRAADPSGAEALKRLILVAVAVNPLLR